MFTNKIEIHKLPFCYTESFLKELSGEGDHKGNSPVDHCYSCIGLEGIIPKIATDQVISCSHDIDKANGISQSGIAHEIQDGSRHIWKSYAKGLGRTIRQMV